jgi:sec-independent protein translocase protein TatA
VNQYAIAGAAGPWNMGWQELLIILAIVLVVFGATKVPEIARSLGTGIKVFRDSVTGHVFGEDEKQPAEEEKPA